MNNKLMALVQSTRPPFLLLTPICIFLGLALARQAYGQFDGSLAVWVMLAALSAHISVNTFNEYLDFSSGLDRLTQRTPFSGGSGGIPSVPEAHRSVLWLAVISLLVTILIGLYLVSLKGPLLLGLGLLGVFIVLAYTGVLNKRPLLCLLAPGLAFGPLFVVGTFVAVSDAELVRAEHLWPVLFASLLPFFLINNLLLLNQLPDVDADKQVGRNTLPIHYGLHKSMQVYMAFIVLGGLSIVYGVLLGYFPYISLLSLLLLLLGIDVFIGIKKENFATEKIIPYLAKNVVLSLSLPLMFALTIWYG